MDIVVPYFVYDFLIIFILHGSHKFGAEHEAKAAGEEIEIEYFPREMILHVVDRTSRTSTASSRAY